MLIEPMVEKTRAPGTVHVVLLWSLTALFAFRVGAQLVQYVRPIGILPPFQAWQGSGLSYRVLLASQLLILALMASGAASLSGRVPAGRRPGGWLIALGAVYFVAMGARLLLGLTIFADVPWFATPLPALFDMVLASYLLTLGHWHRGGSAGR